MNSSQVIDLISDGEDDLQDLDSKDPGSRTIKQESDELNANEPEFTKSIPMPSLEKTQNSASLSSQRNSVPAACSDFHAGTLVSGQASAPHRICREFWKAGDYNIGMTSKTDTQSGMNHVRVHPKFLHSNATSHKWALGAIAELLDNAVDEIQNGATFVRVDKIINPRDGSPALLVQDDGGGMDPECMRKCMSLGYSHKNTKSTIGQYGNGFKTSTMRLGADVIVFSRCKRGRQTTQSIGLLSYTFLRETGHMDIVVPMVDYEVTTSGQAKGLLRSTIEDWSQNFSTILQWCPYATDSELLRQFDDIGAHGTKVIVYNLWLNDEGQMELDFDSDEKDIMLRGGPKLESSEVHQKQLSEQHIANRLKYSLHAYASILYLRLPEAFKIILRGQIVVLYSLVLDLKFPEYILYKPQVGYNKDVSIITTIGFTKEAPLINVHGFCVYHKNRLIMPFWKVFHENSSRGRGVVGVLEANFIEPAHDKQDFERTPVLQRLETRLKQMTVEYWNLHCHLIGYQPNNAKSKPRASSSNTAGFNSSYSLSVPINHGDAYHDAGRQTGEARIPPIASVAVGNSLARDVSMQLPSAVQLSGATRPQEQNSLSQGPNCNSMTTEYDTKTDIVRSAIARQTLDTNFVASNTVDDVKPDVSRMGCVRSSSDFRDDSFIGPSNAAVLSTSRRGMSNHASEGGTRGGAAVPSLSPQHSLENEETPAAGTFMGNQATEDAGNVSCHASNPVERQTSNGSVSSLANDTASELINAKSKHSDTDATEKNGQASRNNSALPNDIYQDAHRSSDDADIVVLKKELGDLEEENRRLKNEDHELDAKEKELLKLIEDLNAELQVVQRDYAKLMIESKSFVLVKDEPK